MNSCSPALKTEAFPYRFIFIEVVWKIPGLLQSLLYQDYKAQVLLPLCDTGKSTERDGSDCVSSGYLSSCLSSQAELLEAAGTDGASISHGQDSSLLQRLLPRQQ